MKATQRTLDVKFDDNNKEAKMTATASSSARSSMDSTSSDRAVFQYAPGETFTGRLMETLTIWASDAMEGAFFGPYAQPRPVKEDATSTG